MRIFLSLLPLAQLVTPLPANAVPAISSTPAASATVISTPPPDPQPETVITSPPPSRPNLGNPRPAPSPVRLAPPSTSPLPIAPPVPRPLDVVQPQQVRPLPGQLDEVPVFNSNSPELIQTEGILLSTFPPGPMQTPSAHLNYPLQGRFDIFAHHVARGLTPDDVRTLYLGIVVYNPSDRPVTLDLMQAVSYLSQDAPFNDLPSYVANPQGTVFAGPGSRVTNEVLRGERQPHWPSQIVIPPKNSQLLVNVPIPLRRLTVATNGTLPPGAIIPGFPTVATQTPAAGAQTAAVLPRLTLTATGDAAQAATAPVPPTVPARPPVPDNRPLPSNGRTILMHLASDGPVYLASLAMFAPRTASGDERVPTLMEWIDLLRNGTLAGPRDRRPTTPNTRFVGRFFYGRVAGVAQGSQWIAQATDGENAAYLSIPNPGEAISYVLSTVDHNTFGTGQIQSAPMLVRYPDTAYRAHGNYGVLYSITLPLHNKTDATQRVRIMLQTPLQDERLNGEALRFRNPPYDQIFFRGTVRLRYQDDLRIPQTRYFHIVQRRGQQGEPLLSLTLPRGDRRLVEVQFIYPPDATPPQVLTVETQAARTAEQ
ncbi:MAG: DUF3370 family protein [Synechococcales cyanobacterium C42_A2020_086]|nr:DUF3370 family protein [Synechococcales cyanobacterium C42_A2020_086]